MAFNQLIETHAAALKYVDSENPRLFRSRCFSKRLYGRNTAGIYVPYADEERGSDNDLRIMSAAGNYQTRRGNSDWAVYDDGFNAIRARKIVRAQQFVAGEWVNMVMPMVAHRYLSRDGQAVDWSGYGWRLRDALNNELDAIFTQRRGVSKWIYRFTSAVAGRYRLVLAVDIQQPAAQVTRMNMTQIVNGVYSSLGVCRATWHWGALDSVTFDWSDMIRTGVYANHVIRADGAAVTTRAVNMTAGQMVEIDPILTQDAGFTGGGASADSDWGIDSAYGNTVATGAVGGNELRSVYRYDISSFASGDTINDVDLNTYVSDQSGVNYNSGIIGPYNGNGTGDPDTDAYATAWGRADVSADNYISGDTYIRTDGAISFDLGAQAVTDVATARAAGSTFAMGQCITTVSGNSYWFTPAHTNTTPANIPELVVDYTSSSGSTGTLAETNANDTSAASGSSTITGIAVRTNASDTSAAAGTTTVTGSLSRTNTNDSVVASGSAGIVLGTVATTNANDTSASSGTTTVLGALARTNAGDTSAASGSPTVNGTLAQSNQDDTASGSGVVGSPSGTVSYTNANDVAAGQGTTTVTGSANITENPDTSTSNSAPESLQGGGGGRRKPFKSYDQRQREREEQLERDRKAKYGDLPKGLADALKPAPSPYKRLAPAQVKAYANAAQNDDEDAMSLIMSLL